MESPVDIASLTQIILDANGHPRHAARRSLDWLLVKIHARSVALWSTEGDDIDLSLGMAVDTQAMITARALWTARGDGVDAPIWSEDDTAVMLRVPSTDLYVYADGVKRNAYDLMPSLLNGGIVAAAALRRTMAGVPVDIEGGGVNTARRDALLAALNLHEWNIARVARATNVTRKTVYERMDRYGIERKRVPK